MNLLLTVTVATLLALRSGIHGQSPTLKIGDLAPPLEFSKFVKGDPVTRFDPDKVYVLDFWGTWCGPCVRDIPHVSMLQSKYPNVVFIGVDEDDSDEDLSKFMSANGDKFSYRIAVDKRVGSSGAMAKSWMRASGDNSFPSVMVVANGRLAWLGKPCYSEERMEKIFKGQWDFEAAAKEYARNTIEAQDAEDGVIEKMVDDSIKDGSSGEFNDALKRAWNGYGKYYSITGYAFDQIAQPGCRVAEPDYKLGEKLLEFQISHDEPSSPWLLGVFARVCTHAGDKEKAKAALQQAISLAEGAEKQQLSHDLESLTASR